MKIETKYFGLKDINEDKILTFEHGIPSFLEEKQFILLPLGEGTPLYILQSIQTPALAFVVTSPFDFFPDYQVKLSEATIATLNIENEADVTLFVILTVKEPFSNTTANLQGPIVINGKLQKGKQVLLSDTDYHTRHLLIPQPAKKEDQPCSS
ncbi:MAG: flagellar assembly protein FliW [Bacillaceae bacterium]|nr:flagellar assembly protein FliW [Bacillaceae bacterium]